MRTYNKFSKTKKKMCDLYVVFSMTGFHCTFEEPNLLRSELKSLVGQQCFFYASTNSHVFFF